MEINLTELTTVKPKSVVEAFIKETLTETPLFNFLIFEEVNNHASLIKIPDVFNKQTLIESPSLLYVNFFDVGEIHSTKNQPRTYTWKEIFCETQKLLQKLNLQNCSMHGLEMSGIDISTQAKEIVVLMSKLF